IGKERWGGRVEISGGALSLKKNKQQFRLFLTFPGNVPLHCEVSSSFIGGERHEEAWIRYCLFSSRRRHTRYIGDWSSDVCSSDLSPKAISAARPASLSACVTAFSD